MRSFVSDFKSAYTLYWNMWNVRLTVRKDRKARVKLSINLAYPSQCINSLHAKFFSQSVISDEAEFTLCLAQHNLTFAET